jgi:hypothetical protein
LRPTILRRAPHPRYRAVAAIIQISDSYADLGASVSDTGLGQAGNINLDYQTFLIGTLASNINADMSQTDSVALERLAQTAPCINIGYTNDLKESWDADRNEFIALVDKRRAAFSQR